MLACILFGYCFELKRKCNHRPHPISEGHRLVFQVPDSLVYVEDPGHRKPLFILLNGLRTTFWSADQHATAEPAPPQIKHCRLPWSFHFIILCQHQTVLNEVKTFWMKFSKNNIFFLAYRSRLRIKINVDHKVSSALSGGVKERQELTTLPVPPRLHQRNIYCLFV